MFAVLTVGIIIGASFSALAIHLTTMHKDINGLANAKNSLTIEIGDTIHCQAEDSYFSGVIVSIPTYDFYEIKRSDGSHRLVLFSQIVRLDKGKMYLNSYLQKLVNMV